MPRKAREEADVAEGQTTLIQMSSEEYGQAAHKFADLKVRHKNLVEKRREKMLEFKDDIKELEGEMQGLAESIKAYEASH